MATATVGIPVTMIPLYDGETQVGVTITINDEPQFEVRWMNGVAREKFLASAKTWLDDVSENDILGADYGVETPR